MKSGITIGSCTNKLTPDRIHIVISKNLLKTLDYDLSLTPNASLTFYLIQV